MYRFVMWGYGIRGKNFFDKCPHEKIVAIIESNEGLQGTYEDGIPIISYEDYKRNFNDFDILLTPLEYEEIADCLKRDGMLRFHLMCDCPREMQSGLKDWLPDNPLAYELASSGNCVLYGLSLFSVLLRESILEHYGYETDIICEDDDDVSRAFAERYPYVKLRKPQDGETVLWMSNRAFPPDDGRTVNAFDFKERMPQYRNNNLKQFKDIHKGERCFVIGNGPSLRMEDLDVLKNHGVDCFGCNMIYHAFSKTDWRPRYYATSDGGLRDECLTEMKKFHGVDAIFYMNEEERPEDYGNIFNVHEQYWTQRNGNMLVKFADDISSGVYMGGTVTYNIMQLAAYMGYQEIYLIGVDFNYNGSPSNDGNHFASNYFSANTDATPFRPNIAECAYRAAKAYADTQGIHIYNATRGGKLEVFERVDFDSLWK